MKQLWRCFKKWLEEHHIWWSWQNLNRDRDNKIKGPGWISGRAWLHFFTHAIGFEWHFRVQACQAMMQFGGTGDTQLQFSLGIPLIGDFYLSFDHVFSWDILPGRWAWLPAYPGRPGKDSQGEWFWMPEPMRLGFYVFEDTLHISVFDNPDRWESTNPKWMTIRWCPVDTFLGRQQYSERDLETVEIEFPMPEKLYTAKVRMFESTWKRPRWPKGKTLKRADVIVESGISIPGKGENSWDQDDDAVYELTCTAETAGQAIGKLIRNVMQTREERGWGGAV